MLKDMSWAIKTENLRKTYRGAGRNTKVQALHSLNLQVARGDVYGFIGPNGAGKTTTIKLLMGLISPSGGRACVFGEQAGELAARKQTGYLSEIAFYYDFMEVRNLLHFYGSFYGIPRREREKRIAGILEMVGLAEKRDAKLRELSKGMLQRFGIAQALISNPPLLILDEPTSGLDPIGQKEIKDIIKSLKERGITIFFSSHKLTEVEHICDRIGIIHLGRMLAEGSLNDFLKIEDPLTAVVFSLPEGPVIPSFEERGLALKQVEGGLYETVVPAGDINAFLDFLRAGRAMVHSAVPCLPTLEEVFFRLIKEREKDEPS